LSQFGEWVPVTILPLIFLKWLHIAIVNEAYRSGNNVSYIRQMLKHNDYCTSLDYLVEKLSYLALHGWDDIDSANVLNLLFAMHKR
jgi:ABC-type multidrug transport system permease subunit